MPAPEDLAANPIAQLRYAALLPAVEAEAIINAHAEDGRWRQHPDEWLDAGRRLASRGPARELGAFYRKAAEVLMLAKLDHDLIHMLLETVGALFRHGCTDVVEPIVEWFVKQASPGHAPICASILNSPSVFSHGDKTVASRLPASMFPMVEWLLMHGAAELRATQSGASLSNEVERPKHGNLLPRLPEAVDERGRSDLLEVALRYVLIARTRDCGWSSREHGLWPQVERALEHNASGSLATDIIQRIGAATTPTDEQIWAPFVVPADFPRARLALLRGLCDGLFDGFIFKRGWEFAFRGPPSPQLPRFHDRAALLGAIEKLQHCVAFLDERAGLHVAHLSAWAEHLFDEYSRFFGLEGFGESSAATVHPFERVVGWHKELTHAVGRSLERALAAAPASASVRLAQDIMTSELADHVHPTLRVKAALAAVAPTKEPATARPPSLASLQSELVRLLNYPWTNDHHGVPMGELLGTRGAVAFEQLANDEKIRLEDGRIVLAPSYYETTLSTTMDPEQALALCVLYFLHELIHLPQGIGDYATVQIVRSTGAEMTLMHLDLSADHAASMLASTAFPRWDACWLKDLTGRSLTAFPASTFHTQAARYRKAARLVSIRLDSLARSLGSVSTETLGGGYLFADYGPAGGHLLILRSASPLGLIKAVPLPPEEVNVLWSAADPARRLAEVDEVLRRALQYEGAPSA